MKTPRQIAIILEQDTIAQENLHALYSAAHLMSTQQVQEARNEIIRRALEREHKAAQAAYEKRRFLRMAFDCQFNSLADKWPVRINSRE